MSNYFFRVVRPIIFQNSSSVSVLAEIRKQIAQKQLQKFMVIQPILDIIKENIQELNIVADSPEEEQIRDAKISVLAELSNTINESITQQDNEFIKSLDFVLNFNE
jgi:hypothetical protein